MSEFKNTSPILSVSKKFSPNSHTTYHANGIMVNSKLYTVGHFMEDTVPFRIIDVPTRSEINNIEYIYRDARRDIGQLDVTCTGPSYTLIGTPTVGEQVRVSFYDWDGKNTFVNKTTFGKITGTYNVHDHERFTIDLPYEKKILCGSAVTSVDNNILYGLVNTKIDSYVSNKTLYAFTLVKEVL